LKHDIQQKELNTNKSSNPQKITRRGFLGSVLGIWGAVLSLPFLYSFFEYLSPPGKKFKSYTERLNPESSVQEVLLEKIPLNSSIYIKSKMNRFLLIRGEGEQVIAISAMCTHLDCLVGYRKSITIYSAIATAARSILRGFRWKAPQRNLCQSITQM